MATDSIIAELRKAREDLAKRFNYDLLAMIHDARKRQLAGGRRVVAFPPKPVRKTPNVRLPKEQLLQQKASQSA
jgi:hypothetical protein